MLLGGCGQTGRSASVSREGVSVLGAHGQVDIAHPTEDPYFLLSLL